MNTETRCRLFRLEDAVQYSWIEARFQQRMLMPATEKPLPEVLLPIAEPFVLKPKTEEHLARFYEHGSIYEKRLAEEWRLYAPSFTVVCFMFMHDIKFIELDDLDIGNLLMFFEEIFILPHTSKDAQGHLLAAMVELAIVEFPFLGYLPVLFASRDPLDGTATGNATTSRTTWHALHGTDSSFPDATTRWSPV
jgi:hypothetical protein